LTNYIDRMDHLVHNLVTVTRKIKMKIKKSARSSRSQPGNRWRLQDAKARLSEVVRQAQQRGPQRVTLHGRDAVVVVRADEFDRMRRPISGRDIVAALATSPLAEVNFDRMTVKSPVRQVSR
jgi:prevent-host-death family protein